MPLTDEQAAIVEAGDVDIAVSAGAGSGKTHVLVERYVHLLRDHTIPQIIAVTFTEAAAAEMRQRVRREVMQRPELEHHRPHVDDAVIGTIHSLCLRLLREHPVEAGLDPGAEVLADDEAELLRQVAAVEAIDAAAEAGDARTEVLRLIGLWAIGQQLPQMLGARDELRDAFAAMPGGGPEGWAEAVRAQLDAACMEVVEPLRGRVVDTFRDLWSVCLDRSDLLATKAAVAETAFGDPRAGDWRSWHGRLLSGADALKVGNTGRGNAWAVQPIEARRLLFDLRDEIDIRLANVPAWNEHDEAAMAALPGLLALFEDACARYDRAKDARHALDFLDLEVEAVRLLEEHLAVAEACRRRYRHIMVDEAQDVSPIQERLIRRLIGEGEGRPRLFLVGDAKQSIYAFRGADVTRFVALRALVRQWQGKLLPLSRSFRTHLALVGHSNTLFDFVFQDGAGGVEMDSMTGREGDPPAAPHLTLMPVTAARGEQNLARLAEANLVASEVARLLDQDTPVWDKRARAYRTIRPGDIAVLLRRFTNVHIFEQALEAYGIPYATPSGTGFYSRAEVVDLGNLLRWLAEPDDDIALIAILRSPMFVLADDTLLALRGNGARRPLLPALGDPPSGLDPEDAARCAFASTLLRDLSRAARTASAADLVETALERSGYEASWAPISGGEQVLANIRKLVRILRGLAAYSLSAVVEYLAQRRDDQIGREGPAVLDRPHAVQVMTVHGAKGLEFPAVFVPEGHVGAFAGNEAIRWRRDTGISFTLERDDDDEKRPQPGFHALIRSRDSASEDQEHLRLFYVAATRAGDYLFVSGDEGTRGWLAPALAVAGQGLLTGVDVRPAVTPDRAEIAQRPAPSTIEVPDAALAEPYTPPLLERPLVIPLRTSTPVTGLRGGDPPPRWGGHDDGLGLLRGTITHRAIELAYTSGDPAGYVDIEALARREGGDLLAGDALVSLVAEVREMVDRFRASEIGRAIARPEARARFEAPFAWDWDGVPVHGTLDLLYRDTAGWRVVDFKTDRLRPGATAEAAAPYLVQVGLYARALQAATAEAARAGLLFLRTGEWWEANPAALDAALAETRRRIDAGLLTDDSGDAGDIQDDA